MSKFQRLLQNEVFITKYKYAIYVLPLLPIILAYLMIPKNQSVEIIPIAIFFITLGIATPIFFKFFFFKFFNLYSQIELSKKLTLTPADIPSLKEFHSRYESKFIPDPNAPDKTQAQQNYEALLVKLENQSSEPSPHTP